MTEHQRDAIDLQICALMDAKPYGHGLKPMDAPAALTRTHPGHGLAAHAINARWRRIRAEIEAHEGVEA